MFGGLEVKGESKKEEPASAAPSSGFSFLGAAAPTPPPKETPAAASAFGFMGGGSAAPPKTESPAEPPSGFSFLQTPTQSSEEAPAPAPAPASSSFGFMSQQPAAAEPPKASPPSSTGFSFMASSPAPETASPKQDILSLSNNVPAGSGITFGGATNAAKKPIKKRNRGIKVGGGRGDSFMSNSSTSSSTNLPPPSAVQPESNVKDEAEEAARRAEVFMQTKLQEQSRLGPAPLDESASMAGLRAPTSRYSEDVVDDELEEAKRAAEEAQAHLARQVEHQQRQQEQQQQQKSAFSWFKGGSKSWGSRDNSSHNSKKKDNLAEQMEHQLKQHGNTVPENSMSLGASALAAAVSPASGGIPSPPPEVAETPADRIAREQEEIKRAMAKRHLAMQHTEEYSNTTVWNNSRQVELPPPPPPPPSPKELFDGILSRFETSAAKAMSKVLQLRQQRNMLLDERFVAIAKERLAVQQISQSENQQTAAAEAEDFDLADRLQVVIDGLTREKAETKAILDNIGKALTVLDSQMPVVTKDVVACFEVVEKELKEFQGKQTLVEKADDTDVSLIGK